jgi:primosomal protein N'
MFFFGENQRNISNYPPLTTYKSHNKGASHRASASLLLPPFGGTIEVERRTDERQVAESLGRVAQLLAAAGNLLGEHGQVVGEAEHVLEQVDGADEVLLLVHAGAGHGFDEPKRAHAESAFSTSDSWIVIINLWSALGRRIFSQKATNG